MVCIHIITSLVNVQRKYQIYGIIVSFLTRYQYGESRAGEGGLILPARAVSYMIK